MKTVLMWISIFSLSILVGCSSSVRLKIKRAPELNLKGVKKLAIKKFKVSGDLSLDNVSTGGGVLGSIVGAIADASTNIMAEKTEDKALSDHHYSGLTNIITQDGYFTVVDSTLPQSSMSGTIYYEVEDKGEEKERKSKDGKITKSYKMTRSAKVTVTFNITDQSGVIIGSSKAKASSRATTEESTRSKARKSITSWKTLVRQTITNVQKPTLQKIAPYFVTERRTLAKGNSKAIKDANKQAASGNWSEAVEVWNAEVNSGDQKDKIACLYNLGVYDEAEGDLTAALNKFEKVNSISGNSKYMKDVARIKSRIKEAEKLKELESN